MGCLTHLRKERAHTRIGAQLACLDPALDDPLGHLINNSHSGMETREIEGMLELEEETSLQETIRQFRDIYDML